MYVYCLSVILIQYKQYMTDQTERKGTTTEGGSASRNAASYTVHHEQGGEMSHSVTYICHIESVN